MKLPDYAQQPHDDSPVVRRAIDWAQQGWPVFPLRPNDKIPLFPNPHKNQKDDKGKPIKCDGRCGLVGHGVLDATRDPDKIRKWWNANPQAGIGGSTEGRVVFDFDIQHGADRKDVFPPSREHLSGRGNGNCHLIYRLGGDLARQIKLGAGVLGPGIDIRAGEGSYVVLPESTHPESGQPYTVMNPDVPEHALTDDEVCAIWAAYGVPLPGERKTLDSVPERPSRDLFTGPGYYEPSKVLDALLGPSGEGGRNDQLTVAVGHYARIYRDDHALFSFHADEFARRQVPPMSPDEIEKVKRSIWDTEHSKEGERERRIEEQVEYLRIRGLADRIYREERRRDSKEAGHLTEGGEFVLDIPEATAIWGDGSAIGWNGGEALILAGPNGVGKSTIAAQLVRARLTGGRVLGLPVAATTSKVLYLAMDRPMQIRRLLNKYLGSVPRDVLDERLVVWKGPPPADLAAHPETLLELAQQAGADTVIVDSLKDAAVGLSSDEVGAAYNRARQIALNGGVELLELHHMVKKGENGSKPDRLEDVYGSIWITAGAGSVVLLWGAAGDTLVELTHLKQPIDALGPWQVFHDREHAVSRVYRKRDALAVLCALSQSGLTTANAVAADLFDSEKPDEGEKQKVRRKLESFEARGWAKRHPGAVKVSGQKPSDGWEATEAGRQRTDEDSFNDSVGGDGGALFDA